MAVAVVVAAVPATSVVVAAAVAATARAVVVAVARAWPSPASPRTRPATASTPAKARSPSPRSPSDPTLGRAPGVARFTSPSCRRPLAAGPRFLDGPSGDPQGHGSRPSGHPGSVSSRPTRRCAYPSTPRGLIDVQQALRPRPSAVPPRAQRAHRVVSARGRALRARRRHRRRAGRRLHHPGDRVSARYRHPRAAVSQTSGSTGQIVFTSTSGVVGQHRDDIEKRTETLSRLSHSAGWRAARAVRCSPAPPPPGPALPSGAARRGVTRKNDRSTTCPQA